MKKENIDGVVCVCRKCGHKWLKRVISDKLPVSCPKCKSSVWWKERGTDGTLPMGRPPMVNKSRSGKVRGIFIEDDLYSRALAIGGGNFTRGVRVALTQFDGDIAGD